MTVTWRTATGLAPFADTTDPYGSLTHTLPTGHATDDLLLAFVGLKPPTTTPSTPTGYTAAGDESSACGQSFGTADAGDVRAMGWSKVDGGSESAPVHDFTARYSPAMLAMLAADSSNSGSGWSVAVTSGSDDGDTGTTVSVVGGSLTWATGDQVVVVSVASSDASTDTSPGLSIANVTVGSLTQQLATTTTTTGTDGAMCVYTAPVTAGGTGAPTFTATNGATGNSHRAVLFLKVTEPASGGTTPVSRAVSTSWNVAATVARARSTTWHTLAAVAQARATTWSVRAAVAQSASTTWHVAQQVTATRSTTWHVASALVAVARAVSTSWHTRALVAQSASTTWHARATVAAARATSWHVLRTVTASRGSSWHVRALVGRAASTVWHTLSETSRTTSSHWNVAAVVTASLSTTWRVASDVGAPIWSLFKGPGAAVTPLTLEGYWDGAQVVQIYWAGEEVP